MNFAEKYIDFCKQSNPVFHEILMRGEIFDYIDEETRNTFFVRLRAFDPGMDVLSFMTKYEKITLQEIAAEFRNLGFFIKWDTDSFGACFTFSKNEKLLGL